MSKLFYKLTRYTDSESSPSHSHSQSSPSTPTNSAPTQRRPSPSISQMPQLGALLEEEEDDDDSSHRTRKPASNFKSYRTKRNSVDFDSLMKSSGGSNNGSFTTHNHRPNRPLSMQNPNTTKNPFNFTSKVSQPPSFQRSGSTSSELSNAHSHSSIATSTSLSSPLTNVSFGKSADFDYGGMPPIPSNSSSSNTSTPPRRKGSIQYRRSDDNMDELAALSGSGGKGPKPLNLVNKARSGSNSSNTSTETSDLFTSSSSPSSRAFLEQQLSNTLDDLSVYRDKNGALEKEIANERKERQASEERVKRLGDKLNQLPNIHEYTVQMDMMGEMREQVFYLTSELDSYKKVVGRAQHEMEEIRAELRVERELRSQMEERERNSEQRITEKEVKEDTLTLNHTPTPQDDEDRPVRPHSLLIDWRFPIPVQPTLNPHIEEEEELREVSPTVDYNDAFAHTSSLSFGREGSVDDEHFGLPPIHTPPSQVQAQLQNSDNDNSSSGTSYGFFRSRSNSLLNRARNSFSPSAYKGARCVSKEKQLERLLGVTNKDVDFAHAYAQAGYTLSDV